jgi:hypothetical protein
LLRLRVDRIADMASIDWLIARPIWLDGRRSS